MILWLTDKTGASGAVRSIVSAKLVDRGIRFGTVIYQALQNKSPLLASTEKKKMPDKYARAQALKVLDNEIAALKPSILVVNDEATLRAIVGKKYTLATVRGSVYFHNSIPVLVIDTFNSIRFKRYGKFVFDLDLDKIARWAKNEPHNEPSFDYRLCKTVDEVSFHATAAQNAAMVASDTETSNGFITCITYTYDTGNGKLISFVVPFFDPFAQDGAHWQSEDDEIRVRKILRELNASPVIKAFQNGTYDAAYEIKELMPCVNYLVDTQNLSHCMWVELPKKLHNLASYFVDHYTYWKDDNKGEKDDEGWAKNPETVQQYWRYCGLDGYYTYLAAVALVTKINKLKWALRNYSMEFAVSIGPCLSASLVGIKTDAQRHATLVRQKSLAYENGKEDLRRLSGADDFNINSSVDVPWLLYDILGAKATRIQRKGSKLGPRSTDEKVLRLMKEQLSPFVNNAIDRILRAKKPGGWLSKYGAFVAGFQGEKFRNGLTYAKSGRFLSWHNAAATETYRFNSGSCQFWTGTNAQNLQPDTQEMFVADDGYVFIDCDYSSSDDWFIAFEAEDEKKIEVLRTKDAHSYNASVLFKFDYDKVVKGKKNYEDWVVNAITGVRQITKKVGHGRNFRMAAETLYNLMGRDMAVATARLLGYKNPEGMTDKELIGMCADIGDKYDDKRKGLYRRIKPWQDETTAELKANDGLVTNSLGITRRFFGPSDDHAVQRELSAYYGQSGTAINVNRSLREIFYGGTVDGVTCIFLVQVHDSLKFLVRKDMLHSIVPKIKQIMEKKLTVKGREFFVPVNVEVGLTDGKHMLPYNPDLTYEQIVAHEKEVYGKKFPTGNDALLAELNNINFDVASGESSGEEIDLGFEEDQSDASEETDVLEDV